ncbi:MAG: DUF1844 domain-containing protein [Holophagales bacterium]|nr:DUF1844 domain-containing protein [Holophagales bacterium]MXX60235.1 DUF1844 domain-containing protein [Holophagales bacterium]MYC11539.1 DUF1844 domain-containing protein [Holophagales bacterium]MYD20821.1 DUF1844 domain-containing protein [Holophagales bacterium]MYI33714.1 DUF1844 domain-containing protein [Holophagales bacterium]
MKVTDRRMFTDDGELREEYRFLEQQKAGTAAEQPPSGAGQDSPASPAEAPPGGPEQAPPATPFPDPEDAAASRMPPPGAQSPGFMDLVAVLAEPIAFLLGDAQLPDGQSAQDLPRARLHIDLLAVLQEKTRGNVPEQETALLEDLLAQLRMRYVEKSRG